MFLFVSLFFAGSLADNGTGGQYSSQTTSSKETTVASPGEEPRNTIS